MLTHENQGGTWLAAARVIGAVGMVLVLSGCVVVPAYYPRYHYYHPYRYY